MTSASVSSYNLSSPMFFPPEPSERTETARGPRSTTSRATTSRRHRSNRSHHGGSSYAPQNEFPYFAQSGDVEIIINADGQEKRYMLHRLILAQNSGFFEASTSEEWSRAQAQAQSYPQPRTPISELGGGLASVEEDEESPGGGGRPAMTGSQSGPMLRWRYELDGGTKEDEVPMLVQKVRALHRYGGPGLISGTSRRYLLCSAATTLLNLRLLLPFVASLRHPPLGSSDPWPTFRPCSLRYTCRTRIHQAIRKVRSSATMTICFASFTTIHPSSIP